MTFWDAHESVDISELGGEANTSEHLLLGGRTYGLTTTVDIGDELESLLIFAPKAFGNKANDRACKGSWGYFTDITRVLRCNYAVRAATISATDDF
ncbi:uncharacterized protein PHALS_09445 [Plasmopara halstedii]|uniref:Uncharacterized protein n=1 Tax=Plasmopara halstedii TaxID=4781 RepID=A0A0P1A4Q6_PLAHL|nr:uncharacterized protein PHALS_09445 [Plasmopara halstedii]CEG35319.1 hypothetical protein PHALS_09445 [Plasmopara halstedii]|eukprot:XP_024571688.1 hypothetical protein PHALS_09445 [Plasmopara halstedii]